MLTAGYKEKVLWVFWIVLGADKGHNTSLRLTDDVHEPYFKS